ncbi:hypothetical protein BIW11_05026 [Tropilaelaps mercedesae]|uniref:Uncharacterized protein n=1 Tax=Tropilaelaps mercedesae TaxID=418985 RepID=A0A1V9WYA1_9ACAR|nr:hypothetical protein BIW11_05026 [Tropilaelaps mercedesae]
MASTNRPTGRSIRPNIRNITRHPISRTRQLNRATTMLCSRRRFCSQATICRRSPNLVHTLVLQRVRRTRLIVFSKRC